MENLTVFLFVVLAVLGADSSVIRKATQEVLQSSKHRPGSQIGDTYFLVSSEFIPQIQQSAPDMFDGIHILGGYFQVDSDTDKQNNEDLLLSPEHAAGNGELGTPELICYSGHGPTLNKISCTGSCYLTAYWTPLGYNIKRGCSPQHHNTRTVRDHTKYCNTNLCNLK